tara:strand:+ start:4262 stop:5329 length:1068 start_codon:yes stop_codon:yes gene_type:complete
MKSIVFLFYDFEIGGAQNALINICNSISAKKNKCYVISLTNNGSNFKNLSKNVKVITLNKSRILFSIVEIYFLIRKIKPFAIISSLYGLGKSLVILKLIFRSKIITCYREATNPTMGYKRSFFWNNLIYKINDIIICNSKCVIKEISQNYNVSKNKLILLRNSSSNSICNTPYKKNNIKKFLFVGRLDRVKRIEIQLKALSLLNSSSYIFDIYCKIVDQAYYLEILSLVKKLKIENNINFIFGEINKYKIYSASDFLILTSSFEGFPTVLLEAVSYNVYPISFNIKCGPNEIIVNEDIGKLVEEPINNKHEAIYKAIKKCWNFKINKKEAKKLLYKYDIDKNIIFFLNYLYDKKN